MIAWFFKYGSVILLFNTIFLNIEQEVIDYQYVFYFTMSISLLFMMVNIVNVSNVILHKAFNFLFFLNLINLIHFLFFSWDYDGEMSNHPFLYLVAKFLQYTLISLSIYYNINYFRDKFFDHIIYLISATVFLGFVINFNSSFESYQGLFKNQNMLASLTGIAFSILLLKGNKRTVFQIGLLSLLFIVSVLSGSRSVFIYIAIAAFYKYGFSIKNFIYAFLVVGILLLMQHRIFVDDIDRLDQWSESVENINDEFLTGYGLSVYEGYLEDNQSYGGAHNAYLSILMLYGVILGSLVILSILIKSYSLFSFFKKPSSDVTINLCIVLITLIASISETLITGVNEFLTILFWISLSSLSFIKYKLQHNESI